MLVGVAFLLATRADGAPHTVALPSVVGKPVAVAASALRARGFVVRIAPGAYAAEARGTVIAVRPSGTSAARGTTVAIVPSSGPRPIAIPLVAGFSQAAAVAALERLGLAVVPRTEYDAAAPSGTAVATMPPAGAPVPPHSSVALTISAGPAPVTPAEPASPPGKAKGNDKGHEKKKHKAK